MPTRDAVMTGWDSGIPVFGSVESPWYVEPSSSLIDVEAHLDAVSRGGRRLCGVSTGQMCARTQFI